MKAATYLLIAGLLLAPNFSQAEENVAEKGYEQVKKAGNTVKRGAKKAGNRIEEATCTGSDLECGAKKVKNRVGEGAEKVGDKVEEKVE